MKALCLFIILLASTLCDRRKIAFNHSKYNMFSILDWGKVDLTAKMGDYWILDFELHKDFETEIGDILDNSCYRYMEGDAEIVLLHAIEDLPQDYKFFKHIYPQVFPKSMGDNVAIRCVARDMVDYVEEVEEFDQLVDGYAKTHGWEDLLLWDDE
jgi:hypothetical protein